MIDRNWPRNDQLDRNTRCLTTVVLLACITCACGEETNAPINHEVNTDAKPYSPDAEPPVQPTQAVDAGGPRSAPVPSQAAPMPRDAGTDPAAQVDASAQIGPRDAGGAGDAAPSIANSDAGVVRASTEPLWVYVASTVGSLRNVADPSQQIEGITTSIEPGGKGATPWSKDGRWLAQSSESGSELHFIDLSTGELDTIVELAGTIRVLDWAADAAFVHSSTEASSGPGDLYALVGRDGELIPVYEPEAESLSTHSFAPDGRSLLFTSSAGATFTLYYVELSDPQAPAAPRALASYTGAPAVNVRWTPDSRWVAFGAPSEENGVKLWSTTSESAPWGANPPGGLGFSPNYSFSPAGSAFVSHISTGETTSALVLTTLGTSPGEPEFLDRAEGVSPATWSPLGDYLTYSNASDGWLQPVGDDGRAATRIPLPGWNASCPLAWTTDTSFIYRTCGDEAPKVRYANLEPSLVSTPVAALTSSNVATSGECVFTWDDLNLYVGAASQEPTLQSVVFPITPVELIVPHPAGKGIAWTVRRSLWYWLPLDDCRPAAEPVLMSATGAISQLEFVPND